jgi:hypothetical protein
MRKLLSAIAALAVLMTLPAVADAQRRAAAQPRVHEFGIDLGLSWYSEDEGESGIQFGTPLDLRVGFPSRSKLMFEGRVGLGFDSKGGFDENLERTSSYTFTPGVNVLYSARPGAHRSGMYLSGGAGLNMFSGGELGGMGFALNGAVGWRKQMRNGGALRYEVGLRYDTEITDEVDLGAGGPQDVAISPSTLSVIGRVGFSFWH